MITPPAFNFRIGIVVLVLGTAPLAGQPTPPAAPQAVAEASQRAGGYQGRPVATYSIVAFDEATGQLGVAVQSHWFSVGPLVAWVEAGVGAVATQSFVEVSYGPLGLELMRSGKSADASLRSLLAGDEFTAVRQVAMVDAQGRVAAHTGENAIRAAGHHTGNGYSVQANLMESGTVWEAMAKAYEDSDGDLAERLLVALEAAQGEGGDIRGRQSAALIVVRGEPSGRPWADRVFDLRVEDNAEPLVELRRLVHLARAYHHMDAGDAAVTEGDADGALREYSAAREMVADELTNGEMAFWHAIALISVGRTEAALPILAVSYAIDEGWRELVRRLPDAGLLPDDEALIERLLKAR